MLLLAGDWRGILVYCVFEDRPLCANTCMSVLMLQNNVNQIHDST